jgi:hypothetical protein
MSAMILIGIGLQVPDFMLIYVQTHVNESMRIAFPCITAGADVVQIAVKAVEILNSMDDYTPIYGIH